MHGRSALDAVGMAYAREVYVRNESTLQGLPHSLVTTFHNASTSFVDKVSHVIKLPPLPPSLGGPLVGIMQCWGVILSQGP